MKTIKQLKSNCFSNIYVGESTSNFVLSPKGDKVLSKKMKQFSMFSRFTLEKLQWIITVTEKSQSEQCEGGLTCCATGHPEKWFQIE